MFLQKRRDFIVRLATLLISSCLTALHLSPLSSSANKKERLTHSILYVGGANASDTNPGTASAPFATIQAAANVAQPGDVVKIRDGVYRETVAPANSGTEDAPIVFTADTRPDGSLCEPVISGAELVETNWQLAQHANLPGVDPITKPIYETAIDLPVDGYLDVITSNTTLAANQVFVRSKTMVEARWPKVLDPDDPMGGANVTDDLPYPANVKDNCYVRVLTRAQDWATYNVDFIGDSTGVLTDSAIPDIPGGWAGGRIKLQTGFIPSDNPITASDTGTITWVADDNDAGYAYPRKKAFEDGKGYLLGAYRAAQDDGYTGTFEEWRELPLANQWKRPYLEKEPRGGDFRYYLFGKLGALSTEKEWFYENGKLYLWAPGGGTPENVEYKARNYGFDLAGRSNIHIKNLNFFACEITTNIADSIWPSNARNWPEAQAAASAGGWVAGAPPWDRDNAAAVPTPANGILIDYCRFKYPNHYQTLPNPGDTETFNPKEDAEITELRLLGSNKSCQSRITMAGTKITGDNCIVRNSVFANAAGSGIVVSGKNGLIQNNYFKDISYTGSWASPIVTCYSATGLRILGNTFWRVGRGLMHGFADHVELAFNDVSSYSRNAVEGGATYTHGRFASPDAANPLNKEFFMGKNLLGMRDPWVPNTYNGLTVTEGMGSGSFKGIVIHHNWSHHSDDFNDQFERGNGFHFDGDTDGASIYRNVLWDNRRDLRASNSMGGSSFDIEAYPLGIHVIYNNTFGTPPNGVDGATRFGDSTDSNNQYEKAPWTMSNNIYRSDINKRRSPQLPNDLFIDEVTGAADSVFLDYNGARTSREANGKPWLIGFGPGQYPSGLGLQLKAGSPAIDRGLLLSTAVKPNGERIHDSSNRPVTFDDPVNGSNPDAGAYEFGGAPVPGAPRYCPLTGAWIPGTTLPQEFIEGQPWEQQWDDG